MRISDGSSDVCSSDLMGGGVTQRIDALLLGLEADAGQAQVVDFLAGVRGQAANGEGPPSGLERSLQPLRRQFRQGRRQHPPGFGRIPYLARVDVEPVVQQVGGQHPPVADKKSTSWKYSH